MIEVVNSGCFPGSSSVYGQQGLPVSHLFLGKRSPWFWAQNTSSYHWLVVRDRRDTKIVSLSTHSFRFPTAWMNECYRIDRLQLPGVGVWAAGVGLVCMPIFYWLMSQVSEFCWLNLKVSWPSTGGTRIHPHSDDLTKGQIGVACDGLFFTRNLQSRARVHDSFTILAIILTLETQSNLTSLWDRIFQCPLCPSNVPCCVIHRHWDHLSVMLWVTIILRSVTNYYYHCLFH